MSEISKILTINAGSSSIRFAIYEEKEPHNLSFHGKIDRIGSEDTHMIVYDGIEKRKTKIAIDQSESLIAFFVDWLGNHMGFENVKAIGHRVVHGMRHTEPELVTDGLIEEMHQFSKVDPEHLPREIELIEAFKSRYPEIPQVACFDTSFHATMPRLAKLLPVPRRFDSMGIQRYGFHGISYAYLMKELERTAGSDTAHGRVILAHLGSGASLAAVRGGQSVDTTMGFTPAGGLPMGRRTGDLDPGVAWFIMQHDELSYEQFNILINRKSGLLGVSETSADIRDLLRLESNDHRAAEAVALFCYQVKKWIGAYAAVLGGLDTLVFSGGVGENQPVIRDRICEGLGYLGVELDEIQNGANAPVISKGNARVQVKVIQTNEEYMICEMVCSVLKNV